MLLTSKAIRHPLFNSSPYLSERVWVLPDCRIETTCCGIATYSLSGIAAIGLSGNIAGYPLTPFHSTACSASACPVDLVLPDCLPDSLPDLPAHKGGQQNA